MRGESICYKMALDSYEELVGEGRKRCWAKRILWSPRSHQRGGRSDGYRSIESSPSIFCTHPVKFREVKSEIKNKQLSAGEQGASWRNGFIPPHPSTCRYRYFADSQHCASQPPPAAPRIPASAEPSRTALALRSVLRLSFPLLLALLSPLHQHYQHSSRCWDPFAPSKCPRELRRSRRAH
jgi:hypothetical protein